MTVGVATGWLIESRNAGPDVLWWAGLLWSADYAEAVRFMRKVDAERVVYEQELENVTVCEHMWYS